MHGLFKESGVYLFFGGSLLIISVCSLLDTRQNWGKALHQYSDCSVLRCWQLIFRVRIFTCCRSRILMALSVEENILTMIGMIFC